MKLPAQILELAYLCIIHPCGCSNSKLDKVFGNSKRVFYRTGVVEEVGSEWRCTECGATRLIPLASHVELMGIQNVKEESEGMDRFDSSGGDNIGLVDTDVSRSLG